MARVGYKVFGLGLSKTGTTSLAAALNILGIKTIHFPHDEKTYCELARGEYRLSILNEYDGAVDTPIAPYYAQLDTIYPGSKFILTIRDKDSWLKSTEYHWKAIKKEKSRENIDKFRSFIFAVVYGAIDFNPDRFSWVYDTHDRNIRNYFKDRPYDLLIMDIAGGDSWVKLCEFLEVEIPQIPFPNENGKLRDHHHVSRDIEALIAPGESYVLIDEYLLWEGGPVNRHPIRLVERGGQYWGPPQDDEIAIREVERLRQAGATHIVFAWPAFWWLDHYADFRRHLESGYTCTLRNERMLVFDLHSEQTQS